MTRVDRMEQLLDSLRQQLLEKVSTNRADSGAPASSRLQGAEAGGAGTITDLRKRISQELLSYDLSTAAGRRRARLAFLESVLVWDLGEQVVRDPKFSRLIEDIEAVMDEDVGNRFDELLSSLSSTPTV